MTIPDPPPDLSRSAATTGSRRPVVVGLALAAALVLVGFGVGYLLYADDDEQPGATTEGPSAELPDDFPVELTVQFFDDAPREQRRSVRREFEQSGLFDSFEFDYFGPLDDGPWNTITGSGHQDDDEAICAFGRQYLAYPLVDSVVSRGTNECPDL